MYKRCRKLWIVFLIASLILNLTLLSVLSLPKNIPIVGTYRAATGFVGNMYIVLDKNNRYCIYEPTYVLEVGSYNGIHEEQFVQIELIADTDSNLFSSALILNETLFLISKDGSTHKFTYICAHPYYDSVPEVLELSPKS